MEIIIKIKVGDWVNDNLDNLVNNQLPPQIIDALHNVNLNYESMQIKVNNRKITLWGFIYMHFLSPYRHYIMCTLFPEERCIICTVSVTLHLFKD